MTSRALAYYLIPNETGLVRGIDTFRRSLYVITPVPHDTLEKVDLLLQGFIQIPTCLMQVTQTATLILQIMF